MPSRGKPEILNCKLSRNQMQVQGTKKSLGGRNQTTMTFHVCLEWDLSCDYKDAIHHRQRPNNLEFAVEASALWATEAALWLELGPDIQEHGLFWECSTGVRCNTSTRIEREGKKGCAVGDRGGGFESETAIVTKRDTLSCGQDRERYRTRYYWGCHHMSPQKSQHPLYHRHQNARF